MKEYSLIIPLSESAAVSPGGALHDTGSARTCTPSTSSQEKLPLLIGQPCIISFRTARSRLHDVASPSGTAINPERPNAEVHPKRATVFVVPVVVNVTVADVVNDADPEVEGVAEADVLRDKL